MRHEIEGSAIQDIGGWLAGAAPGTGHLRMLAVLRTTHGIWLQADTSIEPLAYWPLNARNDLQVRDLTDIGSPVGESVTATFVRLTPTHDAESQVQLFLLLSSGRVMAVLPIDGGGTILHLENFLTAPILRPGSTLSTIQGIPIDYGDLARIAIGI